jgi:peptidoglycan hydrolase-like amidase
LRAPAAAGSAVAKAVRMTSGLAISAEAMVIPAHYSAACGGHTDDGELDGYRYRSVVCETCQLGGMKRRGHGLGLCQTGAMGLAKEGWEFGRIVAKYYPGCVIRSG